MRESDVKTPCRVAFLQASLEVGGVERLVQDLVVGLDPARFRPVAVTLGAPGAIGRQLEAAGQEVVAGLARGRWDPRAGLRLAAELARRGVGLVYVPDSALPLFWAGLLRRGARPPRLVVGFHSTGRAGDALQHAVAGRAAFPVADRLVALSPGHRDFLAGRHRLAAARFAVIPNGVDTTRFHPAEDRRAARRSLGWEEEALHVGIVAALRPEKRHRLFLAAAARLAPRFPKARFLVAGDGPERAALEREAAALRAAGTVRFLGTRHDVPEILRACDLAVLCSAPVVETFPVSLVEALASGTPVVSTDVGSIRDIVRDGETGLLTAPGDVAALAEALGRLLDDPALRLRCGAAARADALERFRREDMLRAYERLFLEVAGS